VNHVPRRFWRQLFTGLILLPFVLAATAAGADDIIARVQVRGSFDDVKGNLVGAIEARGLVINNTSRIGEMLERTGRDLGTTRRVYGNAEVLEFCSATISRQMMEGDPHQIAFCPFTIAIYTLPGLAGTVFISYRHPPPGPGLAEVEQLLAGIVKDAIK
jgi:uncharacterized protein (DUF302 family)